MLKQQCLTHRKAIRNGIGYYFQSMVYVVGNKGGRYQMEKHSGLSTLQCHGITELLEIYVPFCNGFAIPLKEDHKLFLFQCILPLIKCPHFVLFQDQWFNVIRMFVSKEAALVRAVLIALLKYMPSSECAECTPFLDSIIEVMELIPTSMEKEHDPMHRIGVVVDDVLLLIADKFLQCAVSENLSVATSAWAYFSKLEQCDLGCMKQKIIELDPKAKQMWWYERKGKQTHYCGFYTK